MERFPLATCASEETSAVKALSAKAASVRKARLVGLGLLLLVTLGLGAMTAGISLVQMPEHSWGRQPAASERQRHPAPAEALRTVQSSTASASELHSFAQARNRADARSNHGTGKSTPFHAPNLETYRNEVRAFPHGTTPSLVAFAATLEQSFAESVNSRRSTVRDAFFNELARCASDDRRELPFSARSYCLLRLNAFVAASPPHSERLAAVLKSIPDVESLRSPHRGLAQK